jgi:multidrug efflux pump
MAKFFIDRPIFAWVIALIISLAGILSIHSLPIAQYPNIAPPSISVSATYPGASAKTVEDTVVSIIEQELNGVDGLLYMSSSSESSGNGVITVFFETGTDINVAQVDVNNRVKRVESRLPEEVRRQGVRVDKATRNFLMFITISSSDSSMNAIALGNFAASKILDQLKRIKGVGDASLFGTEYAMRVWIDPKKLDAYNLTPSDVVAAIREQNVQIASGELGALPAVSEQMLNATVVTESRLGKPEEFANILLKSNSDGSTVRIRNIGRVELAGASYGNSARYKGTPAAAIGIKLTPDGNALETATLVKQRMTELQAFFPQGVVWNVPNDTTAFIKVSIDEVTQTLVEAVILVFLVMLLFLQNIRATLIPTLVVPIALLGSFAGMLAFGFSINTLTLFGMVLAIGILVDDAIVVVENVERIMREEGLSPRDATRKAMSQITSAIIGITLVLIAVFIPMAFFSGSVGAIYRQFSFALVVSILFSALLALTLTPALCAQLLKPVDKYHDPEIGIFGSFNRWFRRSTGRYNRSVQNVLRNTGRYLLIYLGLLIITGFLLWRLPTSFLPNEDQGYFITVVQLPSGATQQRTIDVLEKMENYFLNEEPAIDKMFAVAGFSYFGSGQNAAIAFIRLHPWDQRNDSDEKVTAVIDRATTFLKTIKDALIFPLNPPPIRELGNATGFEFQLQDQAGLGHQALTTARNQLIEASKKNPLLTNVRADGQDDTAQLRVDIDRSKARALGIAISDINTTLSVALGSAYANDFVREGRVQKVLVQAEASARMLPQDILALRVRNQNGDMVPFSSFSKTEWIMGSPRLERYNGLPSMKISGQAAKGYSSGEAMQEMEKLAAQLPDGFGFQWSGTSHEERLSGAQAPALFALSVLIIFLCLAALYESWSIPFAVILVVPLGVLGAVAAVYLRDMPNDVYFKVGLITIIGLAAKNAILIIEFATELQLGGMNVVDATIKACKQRLRPILMTSLAFTLGVLPLAISSGAGAASRQAIGTGVMGGMITATVFAVIFVPVFFVTIRRWFPPKGKPAAHTTAPFDAL